MEMGGTCSTKREMINMYIQNVGLKARIEETTFKT